ncbi:MAG: hypothetical protein UY21_C0027G0001 [Microgenomates group bacterium GW2011_GWA1_48_10]|uniref:GGDEF domain-containing protein n=1 Tax=Candidatus Gottesmanbacteria bacterium RIFCSPHIGHO2_01_FULL_47_48 TaxID=1798381 RepID=A0A1F6A5G2_9BACT|nr:MAG: hypothetical protein UY21_C0027G0001 [Microgenomates group bacterium GW2011_GWA1_48_10]OGG19873.1 MAG: hypothetical protein A2721_03170 [Candidatus Gottesmanbacteria bacterium RIFCSPHIGHO2_01_FULL_47_48]
MSNEIPRVPEIQPEKQWFEIVKELIKVKAELQKTQESLQKAQADSARLEKEATINEVSGLPNRRGLTRYIEKMRKQFMRSRDPDYNVVLLYGDIAGLKAINETYGDNAGNTIIKRVGELLSDSVRPEDMVANPWGDTYLIILPTSRQKAASTVQYRLTNKINQTTIEVEDKTKSSREITAHLHLN